jgi:hypothetical protein
VPRRTCRHSERMFSAVRTAPTPGRTTEREPSTRIAQVVYVQRSRSFAFLLNRGNRITGPSRFPVREPCQFFSAVTASAIPFAYASFEHSRHHEPTGSPVSGSVITVTSALTSFHRFRRLHADHTASSYSPVSLPLSNDVLICATDQLNAFRRAPQSRRNCMACPGDGSSATVCPLTIMPGGGTYLAIGPV